MERKKAESSRGSPNSFARHLPLLIAFCALLIALVSCYKPVERSKPGPGGLPRGGVTEQTGEAPTGEDSKYPVYPGATSRAGATYVTTDSLEQVKAHYVQLLGVEPEARDEAGDALTFVTPEFILVLVRLPYDSGGGTEISFSPPEKNR